MVFLLSDESSYMTGQGINVTAASRWYNAFRTTQNRRKQSMKTTAVRLYGKNDLRMETFELPAIQDDEILVKIISDSICMSSYKATIQGEDHKRVPKDIAEHPIIIGHEFCGANRAGRPQMGGQIQGGR